MEEIQLNPDVFVGNLQKAVAGHLAEARAALAAIEDGSFVARANTSRSGAVMSMEIPADVAGDIRAREICNNAFLGMARALGEYLDRMIAVRRLYGVELPWGPPEELSAAVDRLLEQTYLDVARDRGLSYPRKVAEFAGITEPARLAALSIFALRRCLEHHAGVPAEPLHLAYFRIVLSVDGREITKLPFWTGPKEARLVTTSVQERKEFPAGVAVTITEQDLEHLMLTVSAAIAGEIRRVV